MSVLLRTLCAFCVLTIPMVTAPEDAATSSASSPRLTKSAFQKQANAVCAKSVKKIYSLPKPQSAEQFLGQLNTVIGSYRRAISGLRLLRPPLSMEARVNRMLTAFSEVGRTLLQVRAAYLRGDQIGVELAVKRGEAPALKGGKLAHALGLYACTRTV